MNTKEFKLEKKLKVTEKELSQVIFEQTGGSKNFALIRSKGDIALFGKNTQQMKTENQISKEHIINNQSVRKTLLSRGIKLEKSKEIKIKLQNNI